MAGGSSRSAFVSPPTIRTGDLGGKQVIAVLPFRVEPAGASRWAASRSPPRVLRELEWALVQALVESGDFFVIDRRNSKRVEALLQEVRDGVASGRMQAREGGKLGQLKGVDIVVTGLLDRLEYVNYDLYIMALKRSEPRSRLGVRSTCITNVADGTLLGKSTSTGTGAVTCRPTWQGCRASSGKWRATSPRPQPSRRPLLVRHSVEIERVTVSFATVDGLASR